MIANPAISAGGFPGSGTGNQGAKRVVQEGLPMGATTIISSIRVKPFWIAFID